MYEQQAQAAGAKSGRPGCGKMPERARRNQEITLRQMTMWLDADVPGTREV